MRIDITYQSLVRVLVVAAIAAALWLLRDILIVVLLAVVIASGIEPAVQWFRRYRVPRVLAVLIVFVLGLTVIGGAVSLILPPLISESQAFLDAFPRYQRLLLQEARDLQNLPFSGFLSESAEDIILNPPFDIRTIGAGAFGFLLAVFGGVFSGVLLFVVSFYFASQEKGIERFLRTVTPLRDEEYVIGLWQRSQAKIGQWLRGQALLAVIIGLLVYFALTILNVRYALSLALLAAIFEVIPIAGPILAAVPAVFFGFLESPTQGLIVAATYVLIQQLESHLIVPVVMRRTVGVSPLLVILSLLAGARLGGILGMLLAVPVAAVIVEFLTDIDQRRRQAAPAGGARSER